MIAVNEAYCPKNHACPATRRCPEGALVQDDIYSAPRIDTALCTECGACSGICRVFTKIPEELAVR